MNKNYLTWGGIVIAIVLGLVGTLKHTNVVENVTKQFGGTSPDIASPYVDFGGLRHWYFTGNFNQGSTTLCSFQSPLSTSTLIYASATITTGTTTALVFDIAKASTPSATTTLFGSYSVSASTLGTIVASTTPQGLQTFGLDPTIVFAASVASSSANLGNTYQGAQFLNFKEGGANGTTNVLTGSCKAEFIQNI